MKSACYMTFVTHFDPFILCKHYASEGVLSVMLVARWKNHGPIVFGVSATSAREAIQVNYPA